MLHTLQGALEKETLTRVCRNGYMATRGKHLIRPSSVCTSSCLHE